MQKESEISDVVIVLKRDCEDQLDATTNELKKLGVTIERTDAGNGVVEGTVATDRLAALREYRCVAYVRVEFTYVSEQPPGNTG